MSKKKQTTKNVPELRFPGFSGEWEEVNFGDIFQEVSNKTNDLIKNPLFSLTVENGITPKTDRYKRDFLVKKNDNFKIVKPGDIVYNPMNVTLGAIDLSTYTYNLAVSGYYHVMKIKNDFDSKFLANFLKTNRMIIHYKKIATGTLIEKQRVHFSEFKNIVKKFPEVEEQQKIGDFFSKLDRQIELEEKKLALLEEQKKGYMQKIFSQKLRFKDENGNEYPEWEEKKIGEILKERNERGFDKKLLSVSINKGVTLFDENIKKDNSSVDKSNYKRVCINDLAYNSMRMWQGASGLSKYDGIVSPAYTVLKGNKEVDMAFISYLFKTHRMIYKFKSNSQGLTSDTWNLKYPQLKNIIVYIPELEEQQKISSYFDLINEKIKFQKSKVEHIYLVKKWFIHKLFL